MDPFLISLIWAVGVGVSSVAGKLADKGFDAAAKPVIDKLAGLVKGGLEQAERETKLADAIRAAIEDSTKDLSGFRKPERSESEFVKYAREIGLERLTLKENRPLLDRVIALALIISSRDDSALVSDALLHELNLETNQRAPFARFLYHLRVRLNEISEFQPMMRLAHETNMENAARIMIVEIARVGYIVSEIAQTVTTTPEGIKALRVQIVDDTHLFEPYLRRVAVECNQLQYLGDISKFYANPTEERALTLADVYTRLETTRTVEREQPEPERSEFSFLERERTRRETVLEAVSADDAQRVVLLGDAGSGKSTFVNHLAFCLTQARLGEKFTWLEKMQGWTCGTLVPVRVVLREFMAQVDLTREPTAELLWNFIRAELKSQGNEQYFELLQRQWQNYGIVMLDGLDEVPDAGKQREFIKAVIEDFDKGGKCHILVTCRPNAYERAAWKLRGFVERTVAPFSPEQIRKFIQGWYHAQEHVFGTPTELAKTRTLRFIGAVEKEAYLQELAASPLLLTLMATVHTSKQGELPEGRALLYQEVVDLLLERWQKTKTVRGKPELGLQEEFGVSSTQIQDTLAKIAFDAHKTQGELKPKTRGAENDSEPRAADIQGAHLRQAFAKLVGNDEARVGRVIYYIRTRAGLLLEKDQEQDLYAFPHRQFQEFLAAAYLCKSLFFVSDVLALINKDAVWWRQVYLLAAGRQSKISGDGLNLLEKTLPALPRRGKRATTKNARRALLGATGAAEIRLRELAQSEERYHTAPKKFQQWLLAIMEQELLTLPERAEAGRLLSKLGDSRAEVNCEIPFTVPVAAGEFEMGGDGRYDGKPIHSVTLSEFHIGKYPVTNAQFRLFVEGDGYTNREYWKYDKGWEWKIRNEISKPEYWDDPQWNLDNHPVVGVSWYEADAYCQWLTRQDEKNEKRKFRLPTEAEWEKAASWDSAKKTKRVYAWGDEFDGQKGNVDASGIGRTSAVGLFSNYPSPCGAMDMTGNVWEWCADWFDDKYYENSPQENPRNDIPASYRVLRGAAFNNLADSARCAYRVGYLPDSRDFNLGFRVAVPPA